MRNAAFQSSSERETGRKWCCVGPRVRNTNNVQIPRLPAERRDVWGTRSAVRFERCRTPNKTSQHGSNVPIAGRILWDVYVDISPRFVYNPRPIPVYGDVLRKYYCVQIFADVRCIMRAAVIARRTLSEANCLEISNGGWVNIFARVKISSDVNEIAQLCNAAMTEVT